MSKILFNLNGKQHLVEVSVGGSVTSDASVLWNEQIHGAIPNDIEIGKMESYEELEDVLNDQGNVVYLPELDENNQIVLDEQGNVVYSQIKKQKLVRKLRKLQNEISSHSLKVQQEEQLRINKEARAYLASTDWYIIRNQETGVSVPQEILDARAAARTSIIE